VSATRLRAKPAGGIRVLDRPEDVPPDQLAKLRAYRDVLEPIIAAYGEVEIVIRPATPIPDPPRWPPLSEKQQRARKKWLARDTARYGLVNWELPPPPSRPVGRAFGRLQPPPDPDDEERVATNACTRCGGPCPPSDLAGSIRHPDGSWVHLSCVLKAGDPA
jgi:hypothetical protein